nr:hypothetical protein [Kibdelosporangium sp. MJ126-NF4]CTQ96541.1 hypothetical protein [Kibdelosporangium sp. MJ126-NF4]
MRSTVPIVPPDFPLFHAVGSRSRSQPATGFSASSAATGLPSPKKLIAVSPSRRVCRVVLETAGARAALGPEWAGPVKVVCPSAATCVRGGPAKWIARSVAYRERALWAVARPDVPSNG